MAKTVGIFEFIKPPNNLFFKIKKYPQPQKKSL